MKNRLLFLLFFFVVSVRGQLVTYPAAPNITEDNTFIYPSPYYKVELIQNDKNVHDFVYCMTPMHTTNNSKSTSWVNFSFDGEVKVRVTNLVKPIDYLEVLPKSAGIAIQKENDSVAVFTISKPGHYSIEFEKGVFVDHPLLVFANPLEEHIPDKDDPNVIFFEPGYHEIGDLNEVPTGKTVYIAGGAYLMGQFQANDVSGVKIRGRGILSGEAYEARTKNHMVTMRNADSIEMEGITMIHAPRYFVALRGRDHYLRNLKMMGWWFSTDGISAGENTLIENCFFKVNDDAVKLYQENTEVRNCVIWQLENGAPFMISWNGSKDFGNIHVHDIDIIRVEHHWDNENLAVICAIHGGKANISDFTIENLRINNSKWRIFHLVTRPNRWGKWDPYQGSLSNFTFRNIEFFGKQSIKSLIMGHDKYHPIKNILFENVVIDNKRQTIFKDFLIIDKTNTNNILIR
nr:hypothetical protein [Allomuricauda sp.]